MKNKEEGMMLMVLFLGIVSYVVSVMTSISVF